MRIYVCGKVENRDAHALNAEVAATLRSWGHEVFLPQEQPHNTAPDVNPAIVFTQDFAGLRESDALVAVGALGADCAWEVGWAQGRGIPTYWIHSERNTKPHPMLHSVTRLNPLGLNRVFGPGGIYAPPFQASTHLRRQS